VKFNHFALEVSNGNSRTNLVSTRTRQNGLFQKYERLARLITICQAVLRVLAKGEFGECYANLVSLAHLASLVSLANLASVG
jgi:hypothetical protein